MAVGESELDLLAFAARLQEVCSGGWRLRTLTGFFCLWLQEHFRTADRIGDELLKRRVWTAGDDSSILIESATRWRPNMTEKRPGLIIKRNSQKVLRQIIADRMMGFGAGSPGGKHVTWLTGSHTVFCIAGEGGEAELLAYEVLDELIGFSALLRGPLGFVKLLVSEAGDLGILEEASQNFVVPITVSYVYEHGWTLRNALPRLKTIDLSLFQP